MYLPGITETELSNTNEKEEYMLGIAEIIEELNINVGSMGICAKSLEYGDVAWCCMDCEKDPTAIICSACFDKGNHEGHRVQLKRNVGGCCDCGDIDAWEEAGFCTDHKGYETNPDKVINKLPEGIV